MRRLPFADGLYRLLLRLFPAEFRGDFGDEMTAVFRDERRDAAAEGGRSTLALWARTLAGFARTAPREHLHILVRDAAYGLRQMRRHAGTTAVVILTIAIGVGANTVMLTVIRSVLLDVPFRDPGRLAVVLLRLPRGESAGVPLDRFRAWQAGVPGLEQIAGFWGMNPIRTGAGPAERLHFECVTANTFSMLGVEPALGRTFVPAEDQPNAPPVVVVSHRFWARALGSDPRAVGQRMLLDGQPYTIVGVMPAAFDSARGGSPQDGWVPLEPCLPRTAGGSGTINAFARIRPDVSAEVAAAQMDATGRETAGEQPRVRLGPLTEQIVGDVREPLLALLGAAVFVLLIACSNVASLMLGRADARRRELAVRLALGSSRARIARQLLTESLVFAVLGGAAGVLISRWTLALLLDLMPPFIMPRATHIALDRLMMTASFAIALASGLLFGLLPALRASHTDPAPTLKDGAQTIAAPHRRVRSWLVGLETALAIALVVGAALEIKTFLRLRPDRPGFDPSGKVVMPVNFRGQAYKTADAWWRVNTALLREVQSDAAFTAVSAVNYVPMSGLIFTADVTFDRSYAKSVTADLPTVTPNYFVEMGIPILRGRAFTDGDSASAPGVAIVNETMARRYWGGGTPLGARVHVHQSSLESDATIVGIAGDVRSGGSRLTARPELYVPFAQHPSPVMIILARTREPVERIAPLLRADLARVDANVPAGTIEPLADIVGQSVSRWRFAAWLVSAFAGIAVCLSAVGLFALVGATVAERRAEIGVRVALGATPRDVLRAVLERSLGITLAGTIAGLGLALATTRFLALWLVGVSPLDGGAFAGAAGLMVLVALAATAVPAWRAMRIDPLLALRRE